ncbi:hypothetical protein [Kineosporia babensis]|uniref:Uncharacterized protein n=1 Tax=Kineosporia babensis TaxID=499548 RepID=A0A9X1N9Z4_9ACTN|nr:hypothetical protein [Kineosporia babensis]MCD5311312.1 hypothetical protein [Kineosporia babensis]
MDWAALVISRERALRENRSALPDAEVRPERAGRKFRPFAWSARRLRRFRAGSGAEGDHAND